MTREKSEFLIAAVREVRVIPAGWQHPRNWDNRLQPLLPTDYAWDGDGAACMPAIAPGDETEIAAYETTTEGTPISPAFPNTPEGRLALVNWCVEHATTFGHRTTGAEGWAAILFGDAAVALDGTVRA